MTAHRFKPERTNGGAYFCDCSCGWSGGVYPDRWAAKVVHADHVAGRPPTTGLRMKPIVQFGRAPRGMTDA